MLTTVIPSGTPDRIHSTWCYKTLWLFGDAFYHLKSCGRLCELSLIRESEEECKRRERGGSTRFWHKNRQAEGTADKSGKSLGALNTVCWHAQQQERKPCLYSTLQSCRHAHSGYSSAFGCTRLRAAQLTSHSHDIKKGSVKQTESTDIVRAR